MSNLGELKQQVYLGLGNNIDGKSTLAIEQAINYAHKVIAMVKDFDELMVLDTTHAFTAEDTKSYHIVDDLELVRPKDIYSIRYMDEGNSRKLEYISMWKLDERIPYTEISGTGRPKYYSRRGMSIELFKIPNEVKPLYIQHSQWPDALVEDVDESPYLNIDPVLVELSCDIALSIIEGNGGMSGWTTRAGQLLNLTTSEEATRPDRFFIAQPFSPGKDVDRTGEYWLNPFIKE